MRVNNRIGNLQANVIERTACNNLECLRDIVDRADISLRADGECLTEYINKLKNELKEKAAEIASKGGNVTECLSLRDRLNAVEANSRDAINCIVDKLTSDSINDIEITREIIQQKENVCKLINDALCCTEECCVLDVADQVKQEECDAIAAISLNLRELEDRLEARLVKASLNIVQQMSGGRSEADNIKNKVDECLQLAKDNIPCDD